MLTNPHGSEPHPGGPMSEEDETKWYRTIYEEEQEIVLPSLDIHLAMDDLYKGINLDEPILDEEYPL